MTDVEVIPLQVEVTGVALHWSSWCWGMTYQRNSIISEIRLLFQLNLLVSIDKERLSACVFSCPAISWRSRAAWYLCFSSWGNPRISCLVGVCLQSPAAVEYFHWFVARKQLLALPVMRPQLESRTGSWSTWAAEIATRFKTNLSFCLSSAFAWEIWSFRQNLIQEMSTVTWCVCDYLIVCGKCLPCISDDSIV